MLIRTFLTNIKYFHNMYCNNIYGDLLFSVIIGLGTGTISYFGSLYIMDDDL